MSERDDRSDSGVACESITDLRPMPSDPNIVSVRVGRRAVARLRQSDVEALGIERGISWTDALAQRVRRAGLMMDTRREAMRWLGRRAWSRRELAERLARKTDEADIVEEVLDELKEAKWLDDEAFARQLAEETCRRAPAAAPLLIEALQRRGVEPDLAERIAAEILLDEDPVTAAEALARTRLKTMGSIAPATALRRLAGALGRRGFDHDVIEAALHRLDLRHEDESEKQ